MKFENLTSAITMCFNRDNTKWYDCIRAIRLISQVVSVTDLHKVEALLAYFSIKVRSMERYDEGWLRRQELKIDILVSQAKKENQSQSISVDVISRLKEYIPNILILDPYEDFALEAHTI